MCSKCEENSVCLLVCKALDTCADFGRCKCRHRPLRIHRQQIRQQDRLLWPSMYQLHLPCHMPCLPHHDLAAPALWLNKCSLQVLRKTRNSPRWLQKRHRLPPLHLFICLPSKCTLQPPHRLATPRPGRLRGLRASLRCTARATAARLLASVAVATVMRRACWRWQRCRINCASAGCESVYSHWAVCSIDCAARCWLYVLTHT
jgi:hypothetical protein